MTVVGLGEARGRSGLRYRVHAAGVWDAVPLEDKRVWGWRRRDSPNPDQPEFREVLFAATPDDVLFYELQDQILELEIRNDVLERALTRMQDRDLNGWIGRVVKGGLQDTLQSHGPIDVQLIPSVTKRIVGKVASMVAQAMNGHDPEVEVTRRIYGAPSKRGRRGPKDFNDESSFVSTVSLEAESS